MELKKLDKDGFDSLSKKWLNFIKCNNQENRVINTEYTQLFRVIDTNGCWHNEIKECFNRSIYSCIVDEQEEEWGIVEMVQSQRGTDIWIKMLNIHLSPQIEIEPENEASTQKRLDVFRAALKGIFRATQQTKGTNTVKIYGRTDDLITFLRGMHDAMSVLTALGTIKDIEVSIEDRWLIFHAIQK